MNTLALIERANAAGARESLPFGKSSVNSGSRAVLGLGCLLIWSSRSTFWPRSSMLSAQTASPPAMRLLTQPGAFGFGHLFCSRRSAA